MSDVHCKSEFFCLCQYDTSIKRSITREELDLLNRGAERKESGSNSASWIIPLVIIILIFVACSISQKRRAEERNRR